MRLPVFLHVQNVRPRLSLPGCQIIKAIPTPSSGSGHWQYQNVTTCKVFNDLCAGYLDENGNCAGFDGGGYDYGGGDGGDDSSEEEEEENPENPCEKMQTQNTMDFRSKINTLKNNLTLKKETGYIENNNGVFTYKGNANATDDANTLGLPNPDTHKDIKGFIHTHPNDFTGSDGVPRIGIKIFSPADVIYFNQMLKNARDNGLPISSVYAVMVSGKGVYQLRFTGNINQIKTSYPNTDKQYREMYKKYFEANDTKSDEYNFLKFMDEQMYVKGVSLVKMNNNGTFTTKTLNADKSGVSDSDCPQ